KMLTQIPDESIFYHASRNHFSNWLMARTEFTLAEKLRPRKISDFANIQEVRQYLIHSINELRESKQRGVIIDFSRRQFDPNNAFLRLSSGSLGGKARGIAFIRALLEQSPVAQRFPDVKITVPKTVVIGTDMFDQFLDDNQLRHFAIQKTDDKEIARNFLDSQLPDRLIADLQFFLEQVQYPLAVRSSSMLEDSQYQPFAGLYATYMLPNNSSDLNIRLAQLSDAIKLIYASTFYQSPKAYIEALSRRIEEEKMAVIVQQLVGQQFGNRFYPSFSGVVQSYNYYPVSYLKPEDGIAQVALGLGKIVVDGGKTLRFCPHFPNILPQFSTPEEILEHSHREFYALNLSNSSIKLSKNDDVTLVKLDLSQAERDGTLTPVGGVYSINDHVIYDGIYHDGPRVITFSHILKSNIFPLSSILSELLEIGHYGMGCAVQIEFAVNLHKKQSDFYFLQIRPMISGGEQAEVTIKDVKQESVLCRTSNALGNGVNSNIFDIIYIKPQNFKASHTIEISTEIGKINNKLNRNYLLIGPGRWGTTDSLLGIPVTWDQISKVQVIVETDLDGYIIEPSQGTHFFHNITSFQIGYFCIKMNKKSDYIDWDWLEQQPAATETSFLRHLHLSRPIEVKIDGRSRQGVILKPRD
ncbi:MAG: PEP/pyruvate-binding domain-containing protein, partial [bacterium]